MNLDGNQASIREACDAGLLAGAVTMVWQHGEVLQVNEIGYRDVDANLPMQRDTLFRIASMTKPVTVAAAMSLVDEGKLALGDPIVRWLPEFADMRVLDDPSGPLDRTHPVQRAILVEDLLTHTSGLGYGFSVGGPISRAYVRLPFGHGPDAWLAALARVTAGASARRAADLQPRHRCGRRAGVADRGQAVPSGARRANPAAAGHD